MENGSFGSVAWSIHRGARTNALARAHQKALHERTEKRTPAPRNYRLSERKCEPAARGNTRDHRVVPLKGEGTFRGTFGSEVMPNQGRESLKNKSHKIDQTNFAFLRYGHRKCVKSNHFCTNAPRLPGIRHERQVMTITYGPVGTNPSSPPEFHAHFW